MHSDRDDSRLVKQKVVKLGVRLISFSADIGYRMFRWREEDLSILNDMSYIDRFLSSDGVLCISVYIGMFLKIMPAFVR